MIDWDNWPPNVYPCVLVEEWKCPTCGKVHMSEFDSVEPGDDNYEAFNFKCDCGAYFKKFWRVPKECLLRSGWRPA
jgi:hypothetical protein